jgi:hypothetical protein
MLRRSDPKKKNVELSPHLLQLPSFSSSKATAPTSSAPASPRSAPSSPPPRPAPCSSAIKKHHGPARPPDHTPCPPNSWILYRSDVMKKIKAAKAEGKKLEIPPGLVDFVANEENILQGDLSKLISCFWKNESKEVKSAYEELSQVKKREVSLSLSLLLFLIFSRRTQADHSFAPCYLLLHEQHAIQYPLYTYQPVRKNANNTPCRPSPPPASTHTNADLRALAKNLKKKKLVLNLKSKLRVSPY